jgi:RNA polymerase sigma factor (sigma-70 family)
MPGARMGAASGAAKAAAFMEQYDSLFALVFSVVSRKVGNVHDAEDISQEVFIRLYEQLETVEKPRQWVLGCLRNVVLEFYRRKQRHDVDIDALFDDMSLSYVNGFREARLTIAQVMDEVFAGEGDRDAALFNLVAVHGYPVAEAARELNIAYKAAVYRYGRLCDLMTDGLKKRGIRKIEELL